MSIASLFLLLVSCSESTEPEDNLPGSIIKTDVPDSIKIPATGQINRALVRAWAEDPNGLKDVDSVYFYSLKPDGFFAFEGNPFPMVDNGKPFVFDNFFEETGDEEADDGIYSFSMLIFNSPPIFPKPLTGTYIFTFYTKDKSGELSTAVIDSIKVYE